jgi:hypothetical protein
MRRTVLLVGVATLLLTLSGLAQEQKATNSQVQSQTGASGETQNKARNLTPEERAKLREKMQNMTPEERAQLRQKARERSGATRRAPEAALQQRVATGEINALKQRHQVAIGELESIKQLAVKEKAVETTKALEKLMARHEEQYQRQLKVLQQRLERLQAPLKAAEGQQVEPNQPQPADKPATQSGKQAGKGSPAKLK